MGFFTNIFKKSANVRILSSEDLYTYLTKGSEGASVSPTTAHQSATVYACVKFLAEDIGKLPLGMYQKTNDKDRSKVYNHPLTPLLSHSPNEYHTSLEFREALSWDLVLRGQAFGFINRTKSGEIVEIFPVAHDMVHVEKIAGTYGANYFLKSSNGEKKLVPRENILHIRDLTLDGVTGVSRITYTAQTIGFSLDVENFGRKLFQNGSRPAGIIKHAGKLTDDARKRLKSAVDAQSSGSNVHGTMVLDEGMEWIQSAISAEDSQFLETRKFQRDEILQIFRMPPHKLGDMSRATYSNIEQKSTEYLTDTLLPWLVRWEQALYRDLLSPKEKKQNYYFKFNIDGIIRADIETRYRSYQIAIQNGILSPDEAREKEDMSPREDAHGSEYYYPANMVVSGSIPSTNGGSNSGN